eukprot:scaffold288_cov143-Ochromonas_danica.AAC.5
MGRQHESARRAADRGLARQEGVHMRHVRARPGALRPDAAGGRLAGLGAARATGRPGGGGGGQRRRGGPRGRGRSVGLACGADARCAFESSLAESDARKSGGPATGPGRQARRMGTHEGHDAGATVAARPGSSGERPARTRGGMGRNHGGRVPAAHAQTRTRRRRSDSVNPCREEAHQRNKCINLI